MHHIMTKNYIFLHITEAKLYDQFLSCQEIYLRFSCHALPEIPTQTQFKVPTRSCTEYLYQVEQSQNNYEIMKSIWLLYSDGVDVKEAVLKVK